MVGALRERAPVPPAPSNRAAGSEGDWVLGRTASRRTSGACLIPRPMEHPLAPPLGLSTFPGQVHPLP
jgi:hypothetical protein